MYEYSIDYSATEKCLRLALFAHRYEAPVLVSTCLDHVKAQLPIGMTAKDFRAADKYRSNRSLVPLALRVAKLVHCPEVVPWAVYMLSAELPDPRGGWFTKLANEDQLFIRSFLKSFLIKLVAMKKLKQDFRIKWNQQLSDYMSYDCLEGGEDCLRQVSDSDDDRDDYVKELSLGARAAVDPLHAVSVYIIPGAGVGDFCGSCEGELSRHTRGIVEKFFNDLRSLLQEP